MEKFTNPQEYRDEKAKELMEIYDHTERAVKLGELKETGEYKNSKIISILKRLGIELEEQLQFDRYYDNLNGPLRDISQARLKKQLGSGMWYRDKDVYPSFLANYLTPVDELVPGTDMRDVLSLDSGNISSTESKVFQSQSFLKNVSMGMMDAFGPDELNKLRESFSGKTIVDVGSGPCTTGYEIACFVGAKGYIAIEPNFYKELTIEFLHINDKDFEKSYADKEEWTKDGGYGCQRDKYKRYEDFKIKPIPFNIVSEPGEVFLKRLPDSSVVPIACGLGDLMERHDDRFGTGTIIRNELGRVIAPKSHYLKSNSLTPILPANKSVNNYGPTLAINKKTALFSVDFIL
jgi:hypothetical protein